MHQLEARIANLRLEYLAGHDESIQEALQHAEEDLAIRREDQKGWMNSDGEPREWYEIGDARRRVEDLQLLASLTNDQRMELHDATELDGTQDRCIRNGRYAEAAEISVKLLASYRRVLGADHQSTLVAMHNFGHSLWAQGKLNAAEEVLGEAIPRTVHVLGDHHPLTLASTLNWGRVLHDRGNLIAAERAYRSVLEGRLRVLPADHPSTLNSFDSLSVVLEDQGRLDEAEDYLRRAAQGRLRSLGNADPATITSLINLGGLLHELNRLDEAESCLRKAVAGRITADHPARLAALDSLGVILMDLDRLDEAEGYLRETLRYRQRTLPKDHPDTLRSMRRLGALLSARWKLDEAENWLRLSLDGYRRLGTDDESDALTVFHKLGSVLHKAGRLDEAEAFFRKALQGHIKLVTYDHADALKSMHSLATVLIERGEFVEAESYILTALDGYDRILREDHLTTLNVLSSLARVLEARGSLAEAEECLRRVLQGCRRTLPFEHPLTLTAASNLGTFLGHYGDLVEAEDLLREVVAGIRRIPSDDHPDSLIAIGSLGHVLLRQGKLHEAEEYLREALARSRSLFTDFHLNTLILLNNMAALLLRRGDLIGAELFLRESLTVAEILRTRIVGDELSRAKYAGALKVSDKARTLSFVLMVKRRLDEAFDVAERARSRALLDLLARRDLDIVEHARRRVERGGHTDELAKLETVLDIEKDKRIALNAAEALLVRELKRQSVVDDETDSADDTSRLKEPDYRHAVRMARLDLNKATANTFAELRGLFPAATPMTIDQVRADLEQHELVLSYLWSDSWVLLLSVPASGNGQVRGFGLAGPGEVGELADLVQVVRDGATNPRTPAPAYQRAASELAARLIPSGVHDQVQAAGRVIVIPDGPLNGIPFELLMPPKSDIEIVYANSATMYLDRRLVARQKTRNGPPAAVLLGDPVFDRERPQQPQQPQQPPQPPQPPQPLDIVARDGGLRGAEISATDQIRLHGGELQRLEGTGIEVERVAAILDERGVNTSVLLGEDATAPNLSSAVEGARYVHLATHGLYGSRDRPYDASLALTQPRQITPDDNGFLRLDDLISSWQGKLQSCKLVVLSACHTQHGIDIGDSVVSLPWGFFYAGAPTVIASLWKVDDRATALLMERLYENLLGAFENVRSVHGRKYEAGRPMTKIDALDEAKQWLQSLPPKKAEVLLSRGGKDDRLLLAQGDEEVYDFSHPYYWAAFILIGSPD